jgi:hypothetical protein
MLKTQQHFSAANVDGDRHQLVAKAEVLSDRLALSSWLLSIWERADRWTGCGRRQQYSSRFYDCHVSCLKD